MGNWGHRNRVFYENTSLEPADSVKNPVSLVEWVSPAQNTALPDVMRYTLETGFLQNFSPQVYFHIRNPVSLYFTYLESAVFAAYKASLGLVWA